jgi:hypothetical protein
MEFLGITSNSSIGPCPILILLSNLKLIQSSHLEIAGARQHPSIQGIWTPTVPICIFIPRPRCLQIKMLRPHEWPSPALWKTTPSTDVQLHIPPRLAEKQEGSSALGWRLEELGR